MLDTNKAGVAGEIVGLYIAAPGSGYTAPTATATGAGSGFAATFTVGPTSGLDPATVGVFQQRMVYASSINKPISLAASRPGSPDDFRKSNPVTDGDAFRFDIFDTQVSRIFWLYSMPGGLLIGTNSGVVQLTGGSTGTTNPVAVSATNAVIVPRSQFGSADIAPIVLDHNVLYVQTEGTVREMTYNFQFNIFAGEDVTLLSNHFFTEARVLDWAYADAPNKAAWVVLNTGTLLSLTYLKAEKITGWARHDTPNGIVESITTIQEGEVNAVYFSVLRFGSRWIERQAQQRLFQASDAWQLDGALSTISNYPAAQLDIGGQTGRQLAVASAPIFLPGHIDYYHIHAVNSRATIVEYLSPTQVMVQIDPDRPFFAQSLYPGLWRLDPVLSTVTGLGHMEGTSVYALVDGTLQGPFTVTGGAITLTTPGSQVLVGYRYSAQLQPLYIETPGADTIQGKRKKVAAASVRVRNAAGLKYGPTFNDLRLWGEGTSSTDDPVVLPYRAWGLYSGDQRLWLNQEFGTRRLGVHPVGRRVSGHGALDLSRIGTGRRHLIVTYRPACAGDAALIVPRLRQRDLDGLRTVGDRPPSSSKGCTAALPRGPSSLMARSRSCSGSGWLACSMPTGSHLDVGHDRHRQAPGHVSAQIARPRRAHAHALPAGLRRGRVGLRARGPLADVARRQRAGGAGARPSDFHTVRGEGGQRWVQR